MLQDASRLETAELDCDSPEIDLEDLRSFLATCRTLPSLAIVAGSPKIFDRILDDRSFAAVTDFTSCPQQDADARCELRKRILAPYVGQRLICVLINLPGVTYTVEVDPVQGKVVHWESVAR